MGTNVPCPQNIWGSADKTRDKWWKNWGTYPHFMGQCPTELEQSGTFGNFMCQLEQKRSLGRTLHLNYFHPNGQMAFCQKIVSLNHCDENNLAWFIYKFSSKVGAMYVVAYRRWFVSAPLKATRQEGYFHDTSHRQCIYIYNNYCPASQEWQWCHGLFTTLSGT